MWFAFVLPVHNEAETLAGAVDRIVTAFEERGLYGEVLLVENGSSDASRDVAESLAGERGAVRIRAFSEAQAGIGWAYARGIRECANVEGACVVLTAADLPFGFSDLDGVLSLARAWSVDGSDSLSSSSSSSSFVIVGSKAHPASRVEGRFGRGVLSRVYRSMRSVLLGMRVGDSQGTIFLGRALAQSLLVEVVARDFFFTTELLFHAERRGVVVDEVPVVYEGERRESTVRPLRHGAAMLVSMLRVRLGETRR